MPNPNPDESSSGSVSRTIDSSTTVIDRRYIQNKNCRFIIATPKKSWPLDSRDFSLWSKPINALIEIASCDSYPGDSVDNSPTIYVDYRADEWHEFLEIIHNSHQYFLNISSITFPMLNAAAKIGKTYGFPLIVEHSMPLIKKVLTKSYVAFKNLTFTESGITSRFFSMTYSDGVRAVNLARTVGDISLLPIAIYLAAQLGDKDLLTGIDVGNDESEMMPQDDVARADNAYGLLMYHSGEAIPTIWHAGVSPLCKNGLTCKEHWDLLMANVHWQSSNHFLLISGINTALLAKIDRFCAACFPLLRERVEQCRRKLWNRLPTITGVPQLQQEGWDIME